VTNIILFSTRRRAGDVRALNRFIRKTEVHQYFRLLIWTIGLHNHRLDFLLLCSRILNLWKHNGAEFVVLYLKEATRIVQHYVSGLPTSSPSGGVLVRVDGSGIPMIIPGPLRILIRRRSEDIIRGVLTSITLYRVIRSSPKLKVDPLVDPFKGMSPRLPDKEVSQIWEKRFSKFDFMLNEAELLASVSAGPNHKLALVSLLGDAIALRENPHLIEALGVLCGKVPGGPDILDQLMNLDVQELTKLQELSCLPKTVRLGKLATKLEAAGKVRLFAITDGFTQAVLKPVHDSIMNVLRQLPEDGTFNQGAPIERLRDLARNRPWYSFDLTSATDRLPIEFQTQIVTLIWGPEFAQA